MGAVHRAKNTLQLTLAVIKPDVVAHPFKVQEIKKVILENNFLFIRSKVLKWTKYDAERFYAEHKGNIPITGSQVHRDTSGPISAHALAGEDAISRWRQLMGPTKISREKEIAPESIRAKYGLSDTQNAVHGSDSPDSVRREIKIVFPEFCIDGWYENEEKLYRTKDFHFCNSMDAHVLNSPAA
ncbi:nucleoside diphosphate kinase 6-like [Saccoglossus kowalevskii]